jgi:ubiquinone biosynthesis protein UbiJ
MQKHASQLAPFATAAIETAINRLVKENPEHGRRVTRLKGQVLQLHLKELDQDLIFVFSQQVDVLARYEGEPDCRLSLSLAVLPQLRDHSNITTLIKQEKIELDGDLKLAQSFADLLQAIRPDIEEWLSRYTGDIVAHTLVQGVRDTGNWLRQQAGRHQQHLAEVLTEEWRMAPPPLEVAHFCDQVEELHSDMTRLETRLKQLLEKA